MRDPYVAVNDNSWRELTEIDVRLERGEIDVRLERGEIDDDGAA